MTTVATLREELFDDGSTRWSVTVGPEEAPLVDAGYFLDRAEAFDFASAMATRVIIRALPKKKAALKLVRAA
jgi:hypothetical protein